MQGCKARNGPRSRRICVMRSGTFLVLCNHPFVVRQQPVNPVVDDDRNVCHCCCSAHEGIRTAPGAPLFVSMIEGPGRAACFRHRHDRAMTGVISRNTETIATLVDRPTKHRRSVAVNLKRAKANLRRPTQRNLPGQSSGARDAIGALAEGFMLLNIHERLRRSDERRIEQLIWHMEKLEDCRSLSYRTISQILHIAAQILRKCD